jgi:uncharacterized protein YjbI with pentapeptide repeats
MAEQTKVEWPMCEQAGCIGIRLASARMCLAHASEDETAAALKLIGDTGVIDARGLPITDALLERILSAVRPGENEIPLIKGCKFSRATFDDDAEFGGVTFSGDARFNGATFSGDANFLCATFSGDASFERAIFKRRAWFEAATFGEATPFSGDVTFRGATFDGDAEFGEATFSGYTVFSGATFSGRADFEGVTVSDDAIFDEATFKSEAWFGGAAFDGYATFVWATFNGEATFREATFDGGAIFDAAIFTGDAMFAGVVFKHEARFGGVVVRGAARFAGARFEQARQFGPVLAIRGLVLDDVLFTQPVEIEVSSTGLCCRRARFPGGVQFRLRWARVVLDDTDLAAPSILAGIPRLSSAGLARREEQISRAWRRLLADEISERPQLVSLQRANVAGLGLSNATAVDCRFAGAHNLDKLRLESDISFAAAPSPVGLSRRWGGREVIAEEHAWRADRSRRWVAPGWPGWLDDERPGVLDPGQIAGLYRALRKGREDSKDEPGAADFYYGEMEMRRHARPGWNPDSQSDDSRGRVEQGILTAYWLVSGYGLRAWRAVAWLAAVTSLLAVAFHFVGFAVPPHPVSYWTSLLYAFRATLSLTDNQVTLTAWGQLLQAVLRLTGPVLLGLALLALRGRVKR